MFLDMFVCLFVCLSVRDYIQSKKRVFRTKKNNRLSLEDVLNYGPDPGSGFVSGSPCGGLQLLTDCLSYMSKEF